MRVQPERKVESASIKRPNDITIQMFDPRHVPIRTQERLQRIVHDDNVALVWLRYRNPEGTSRSAMPSGAARTTCAQPFARIIMLMLELVAWQTHQHVFYFSLP